MKPVGDIILENEVSKLKQKIKNEEPKEQRRKIKEFKEKYKKDKADKLAEYEAELLLNTGANPRTYTTVSSDDIANALRKESFFWRKFPVTSNVAEYYSEKGIPVISERKGGRKTRITRRYKRMKSKKGKSKRRNKQY